MEHFNISTLEERRSRGDLIQTYKVLNNQEKIDWYTRPLFAPETSTRAGSRTVKSLKKETMPSKNRNDFCHFANVRDNFLLNRVTGQ